MTKQKTVLIASLAALGVTSTLNASSAQDKGAPYRLIRPFNSYVTAYDDGNVEPMRPDIFGTRGVVATGNYRATLVGIEVLQKGGNAFDAGVAAAMALKAVTYDIAGWTGVAPLILYSAAEKQVITRTGAGTAPAAATLANYIAHRKDAAHAAIVPADVDVWLAALDRFGTMSFEEVAQYTLTIAEEGFHLHHRLKFSIDHRQEAIKRWPYNAQYWLQNGEGRQRLGSLMVNKDLGKLIRYMIDAERRALTDGGARSDGIWAARDAFYKGEPARAVDEFFREHLDGQMTYEDLANYQGEWDEPLHTTYRGYDVYTADAWSQGPRLILMLNMLENFDLKSLGYNTPEYIHVISQAINLAMSDSHKYLGDPDFVDIPEELYSKEYARERIKLIDMERAFQDMPPWGDPINMKGVHPDSPTTFASQTPEDYAMGTDPMELQNSLDTTCLNVMDGEGNVFSMTESDGHLSTPLIPGWGFGLGSRGGQFNLDPGLANVVAPGKRPRNTNTPFIIMKDGKPFLGLSLAGGDMQAQALMQIFFNVVEWGMTPQQAMDHPRLGSYNFPGTGQEINSGPGRLNLEGRIPNETFAALTQLGHKVGSWGLWSYASGDGTITYRDPETGFIMAAADPRREMYALGY
ncbi:MAG: gamma-glutamyltransferase family protein [Acidobacteriota bacterium]